MNDTSDKVSREFTCQVRNEQLFTATTPRPTLPCTAVASVLTNNLQVNLRQARTGKLSFNTKSSAYVNPSYHQRTLNPSHSTNHSSFITHQAGSRQPIEAWHPVADIPVLEPCRQREAGKEKIQWPGATRTVWVRRAWRRHESEVTVLRLGAHGTTRAQILG